MKRLTYISLIALILCACENKVDMPAKYSADPQLVLNSIITAGQPVQISLSRSVFMLDYTDQNSIPNVTDGQVRFTVNDSTENLTYQPDQQSYNSYLIPTSGDSITIWATDDTDTIYGSVTIPEKIDILIDTVCVNRGFKWTLDYRRDSLGNYVYDSLGNEIRDTTGWDMRPLYKATVRLKDPYPQRDAYLAAAFHINEYADTTTAIGARYPIAWKTYTTTTASNLVLSQLGYNVTTSAFTSDHNLNGDTLRFTFSPNFFVNKTSIATSNQIKHIYLVVQVYHLDYDYYNFLASANLSSNYSGNTSILSLLGEPQHTYSNIHNGLGIIGAQTLTSDTLVMY